MIFRTLGVAYSERKTADARPMRNRDADSDARDQEGAVEELPDAELGIGEERAPRSVGEEPSSDLNEERDGLREERDDDSDRREDRDRSREEEQGTDDLLAPATALDAERPVSLPAFRCQLLLSRLPSCVSFGGAGAFSPLARSALEGGLGVFGLRVVHRDDQRGFGDRVVVVDDELHEPGDSVVTGECGVVGVHEQRP